MYNMKNKKFQQIIYLLEIFVMTYEKRDKICPKKNLF